MHDHADDRPDDTAADIARKGSDPNRDLSMTSEPLDRRFRWTLAGIVALAAAWRVLYVLVAKNTDELVGDQIYYAAQAVTIANGDGYADPFIAGAAAADHAPLTPLALAPVSWVDASSTTVQRLLMAMYGVAVVIGVAALARWLFGRPTALIAAAVSAVYANFWMNDALVMSETLATGLVVAVLLATYVHHQGRSTWSAVALGAAVGLAGLARAELLLLGPLIAIPLMLWSRYDGAERIAMTRRLGHLAIAGLAALAMVSPWVIRNQIRFDEPVTMSSQDGLLLIGTNCPAAFEGPGIGFWALACADAVEVPEGADQSVRSAAYRDVALEYLGDNLDKLPKVVAARLGRGLSFWQTDAMTFLNVGEGRERWASIIGLWQYWILLPLAAIGLWLWPSKQPRWPVVVAGGVAVLTIAAFYGIPRFRIAGEVGLVLAGSVTLEFSWRWIRQRLASRAPQ